MEMSRVYHIGHTNPISHLWLNISLHTPIYPRFLNGFLPHDIPSNLIPKRFVIYLSQVGLAGQNIFW